MKRLNLVIVALLWVFSACEETPKITTSSSEALRLYDQAVSLIDQFYYTEAKATLERALRLDTNFAMASARLALVHARAGNEDSARLNIARAMSKLSQVSRHEQMVIRILDYAINFRNTEAAGVADSLLALYPKDVEVYVLRGGFYESSKNFDAALDLYKKAITIDTSYAPAVMSLGYAYSASGDKEKALGAMERYIRLAPQAADPRASYADILLRVGRYDEALEQYQKSLELKPDYWYSINRIGDVYAILGRLAQAEKQYDLGMTKMVMNNQTRATHVAIEADLHMHRGNYSEALRLYEQSLALDSTNGKAAFGMVQALMKMKKFNEAKELIEGIRHELIRRNLTETNAMLEFHWLKSKFYEEQNSFAEAKSSCDSAMQYGSALARASVYNELAVICLKQRDYDNALDALDEALRFNPNSPHSLMTLTKVYHAMGDKQMTSEISKRLLDLWKNADKDFLDLIELRKLIGRLPIQA